MQHQINTDDHPAVKQRVRCYLAACREETCRACWGFETGDKGTARQWPSREGLLREGLLHADRESALQEQHECLLDLQDTTTAEGQLVTGLHNATVVRARKGLFTACARMQMRAESNELLRDIRPRREEIQVREIGKGDPEVTK